jgi:hypothetical protein
MIRQRRTNGIPAVKVGTIRAQRKAVLYAHAIAASGYFYVW